jgi:hypothetical protein
MMAFGGGLGVVPYDHGSSQRRLETKNSMAIACAGPMAAWRDFAGCVGWIVSVYSMMALSTSPHSSHSPEPM